jgi:hypothetical protein
LKKCKKIIAFERRIRLSRKGIRHRPPMNVILADVETIERSARAPLAHRLGDVAHVSPLLHSICRIAECPESLVGEWLLKTAIRRGASHYERDFSEDIPDDAPEVSDEEIGVALCLGQHPYESAYIRAAAQLLSSPRIDQQRLARLAEMERIEPVLLHIARVAARFAPEMQPWAYLLHHLGPRLSPPRDALPHWSRFVSQTGVTPFAGPASIQWLRRRETVE